MSLFTRPIAIVGLSQQRTKHVSRFYYSAARSSRQLHWRLVFTVNAKHILLKGFLKRNLFSNNKLRKDQNDSTTTPTREIEKLYRSIKRWLLTSLVLVIAGLSVGCHDGEAIRRDREHNNAVQKQLAEAAKNSSRRSPSMKTRFPQNPKPIGK